MCGRYSWFQADDLIPKRFGAEVPAQGIPTTYNAAPGMALPIITAEHAAVVTLGHWGFAPHFLPATAKQVINARAETLSTKPYFRDAFADHRCLVLADGFYEWQRNGKIKIPYRIQRKDGQPFAFAGLYDVRPINGTPQPCFTIITTDANHVVAPIHDRMPVMLTQEQERLWLQPDLPPTQASSLLQQYPDDQLEAYRISTKVNTAAKDDASLLKRV